MTMLIENPYLEEQLIAKRRELGLDRHDEVWEGVYFMSPEANIDHQKAITKWIMIFGSEDGFDVFPGINLAASSENWSKDFRVPDVAVFSKNTAAVNHDTFWTGPADFLIEITSPGDRTYDKISFYQRVGARELLIVNRQKWRLDLYRHIDGTLQKVGESNLDDSYSVASKIVPFDFRLIIGEPRPQIEVTHQKTKQQWIV